MIIKSIVLPVLALIAVSAPAQKMAVVDMQGAILQTKDGQKAAADLKAKYDPIQKSLSTRGQTLSAKQEQYRKTVDTMSEAAKTAAERDIQQLSQTLQREADDAKADAQQDQNKMLGPILQRLEAVMRKYATEKQIAMIVDLSSQPNNLLYAAPSVNITGEVIALYNAPAAAEGSKPPVGIPAVPKKTPAAPAPKP